MNIIESFPTVSIGMPVYNDSKYITAAIESLLNQTYTDFELIISDNASSDATSDICKKYSKCDNRIRYYRQSQNIGALANFQYVLTHAKGKYFMWAAGDDRRAATFLEKSVSILEEDEKCGLVFSNYLEKNLETGEEKTHTVMPSNCRYTSINFLIRTLWMCPSMIYGLFRKNIIQNVTLGEYDFSDVHFVSEITLISRVRVINEYLYTAGTKGVRSPYSLTFRKIDRKCFLRKQYQMLAEKKSIPVCVFLYFVVCLAMIYNKIVLWRY
ncbi:MAG: glycosyltransferase family 2 protein [Thermodesulfobacteriota bacterium]